MTELDLKSLSVSEFSAKTNGSDRNNYRSQSEIIVTFSLGWSEVVDRLKVVFNLLAVDTYTAIAVKTLFTVNEGATQKR